MLKTFKALLRPAAYQSYSQYHNVNTKLYNSAKKG